MLPGGGYLKAANSPVEGGQELILKQVKSPRDTEKAHWNLTERWLAVYYKSSNIITNLKSKKWLKLMKEDNLYSV